MTTHRARKDALATQAAPPPGSVRAVRRALAILVAFEAQPIMELRDVAERAGLDKATARRLLLTLMAEGFVVQDAYSQAYALGPVVRRLAGSMPDHADLRRIATPVLDNLAAELRVTAFLSVYRDGNAICLERVHDMRGMEVRWWTVGGTLPFNCGGAPKLFLALQDEAAIERALSGTFVALTPKSIMEADTLRRRLALIRRRDYEFALDDVALGVSALAVPLRDSKRQLVACISIAGLTPQMTDRGKPLQLPHLIAAARAIEAQLG